MGPSQSGSYPQGQPMQGEFPAPGSQAGPPSAPVQGVGAGAKIEGAGALISAIGGYEASRFNMKVARYNQRVSNQDAVGNEQLVRDQARKAMGDQLAVQGGAGIELGAGSAMDALHESAVNAQLDALNIRRKAAIQSTGYDIERANAKAQGNAALWGGVFKFAADYAAAGSAASAAGGTAGG